MRTLDYEILIALLAVSTLVIVVGLFSKPLKQSYFSGMMVALFTGIAARPLIFDVLHVHRWADEYLLLEEVSRITLAIGLMGTALQLPRWDIVKRWRTVGTLIGLVMPVMGAISGFLAYWLLNVPLLVGLLIGTIVMPTDPVLARSVAEGELARKYVPERLRNSLLGESGINDGFAFPFVLLLVDFLSKPPGRAITYWVLDDFLWSVVAGVSVGLIIGCVAGWALRWSEHRGSISPNYLFAYSVALAIFTVAAVRLLDMDGILSVFVAGIAFVITRGSDERTEQKQYEGTADVFFSTPYFFLFGLAIPWQSWIHMSWRGILFALAVIVLRRLPPVFLFRPLMRRQLHNTAETAFVGWFGPMGVSAVFYAMLAIREGGVIDAWGPTSLVVFASVLIFGVTGAPFSRALGRYEGRGQDESSSG